MKRLLKVVVVLGFLVGLVGIGVAEEKEQGLVGYSVSQLIPALPEEEAKKIKEDAYNLLMGRDFSKGSFGMKIDKAVEDKNKIIVKTTGAVFVFDKPTKTISVEQRIPKARKTANLKFIDSVGWDTLSIRDKDTGAVWLKTSDGKFNLRINCDSLLMFSSKEKTTLRVEILFKPINFLSLEGRYRLLDNYGGIGLYPLDLSIWKAGYELRLEPTTSLGKVWIDGRGVITYNLEPDEIFWVSSAPPKPYDWSKRPSDKRNIAWHNWGYSSRAPSDEEIKEWSRFADILLLHTEGTMWKGGWQRGGVPFWYEPADEKEYKRTIDTAHKQGMKVVVYAAPIYFAKGLLPDATGIGKYSLEKYGSRENLSDFSGRNFSLYYEEVKHLKDTYGIDGVYLDELYPNNTVRAYIAVRKIRELFGDSGVMVEHNDGNIYNVSLPPSLTSWYDFQNTGESMERYWNNEDYLRYCVSTYNIANINDFLCNNTRRYFRFTGEKEFLDDNLLQKCLDNNIYQFYAAYFETRKDAGLPEFYKNFYRPFWEKYYRLMAQNPDMKGRVERVCAKKNGLPRTGWENFLKGISGKEKITPLVKLSFDQLLSKKIEVQEGKDTRIDLGNGWSAFLGGKSNGSMEVKDGVLHIRANRDTCAYIEFGHEEGLPEIKAIECRVKTSQNGGDRYGIGMALRWCKEGGQGSDGEAKGYRPWFHMSLTDRGTLLRYSKRTSGAETLGFTIGEWYTLRYRFIENYCIAEVKLPDGSYMPVDIQMIPSGPRSVVIGKVETAGRDIDSGGSMSECWIDEVSIY